MKITHFMQDRRDVWDCHVSAQPGFNLMQSWDWGQFKQGLGWKVFRIAVEEAGSILACTQLLIKPLPMALASVAYIPRDARANWQDDAAGQCLREEIHRVARLNRAIFLKVEPLIAHDSQIQASLLAQGFVISPNTNQPRATITMDLTRELDQILASMRKKSRMYIRAAAEKGVTVRRGEEGDLPAFYELMVATARREGFSPRSFEYYAGEFRAFHPTNQMVLLMAYQGDQLLAVRTAHCFGDQAAEFHGGSSGEALDLRPNYLLVWEAIRWARERGCRAYDFWGIPDPVGEMVSQGQELPVSERTDGLWGVYRFKSGFSKDIVYYTGAYDFVYNAPLYQMLNNRFFNAETLEWLAARLDAHDTLPSLKRRT